MVVNEGSCPLGLWHVHVVWSGDVVMQVCFLRTPAAERAPRAFIRYCAGETDALREFRTPATDGDTVYARIYRVVQAIPAGQTRSYGEVAAMVGTSPRVVGNAMRSNPTPLVVPCHRVVAKGGIGGFSPSVDLKRALLALEGVRV
ncbi:methylated-DNA--[protein]-cysteine S-methyltransferase [Methanofollis fontis]|uniref:Cysteine methyltransferase n=1 Tax=Methanofollis fontis TaxID=2052832 RepID=A0A483CTU1_9EURY|nr:MGMT family protein [Methanofollis fontis]TAJ44144.1 cysteine methyltransferase [Methanofollis fontis]